MGSKEAAKAPTPDEKPCDKDKAEADKAEPKGPPGFLPPWLPHLEKPPQKPPPPPVAPMPNALSPPPIPPPIPSIHPLHWLFTPKDGSQVDEYWMAPRAMDWKGYKPGQKFQEKGWKWLPNLGWTSADNWQFKHLKETPPGVYELVALSCVRARC